MDIKNMRMIGFIVVIGLVIVGLNFMPDQQADVKVKKQSKDRRIANIEAFGRLYGLVRYFHPSDEAAGLDWNRFGVYGVAKVKDAANEQELKAALEELFLPIAPTLSLSLKGEKPQKQAKIKSTDEVIAWQHYGPPGNGTRNFQSKRMKTTIANGEAAYNEEMLFPAFPKPGEKYEGSLGKSIKVSVPLILSMENGKTLGTTEKSWEAFEKLMEELINSEANLTTANEDYRHAGVIATWNVLAHFHPAFTNMAYEDVNNQLAISLKNAADDQTREEYVETLSSLMLVTNDGLASLSFLDITKDFRRLPFMADIVEDQLVFTVAPPYTDFKTGDIIETLNGVEAKAYIESIANTIPGSRQFKLWRAIDSVMDDEKTNIVYSRDGHKREAEFTERDLNYIDEFNRIDNFKMLGDGVYYLNPTMNAIPALEMNKEALLHAKGIIFDMRGAGLDDMVYAKLQELITNKPAKKPLELVMQVIYPYRKDADFKDFFMPEPLLAEETFKGKLVFLSYSGTLGRPEHFLNYVKDNGLGTIVGQPTAGAHGTYQSYPITLNMHGIMTGTETFTREGVSNYSVGVQPDIQVNRTLDGVRDGVDEYVEKALEVIRGS
ncbi:hypothetical protein D1B31_00975 [Neobacillus notoginsengisoli]|uniref:Tail specific protease domain-containing protein n=1 Tax=Neobacillus notoginsengisoli TaxID=1578198 RepID=A0A417YZQ8_9BACI|nr:S41 family peptidase [Neobacillus notoginsengisoli]RHW43276.1 hypothetical protein D1B31_00975 [Neobacillus notoginsengisoli]